MSQNITKNKTSQIDLSIYIKSFLLLMKPRVMSLVLFTCMVGLLIAPYDVDLKTSLISLRDFLPKFGVLNISGSVF